MHVVPVISKNLLCRHHFSCENFIPFQNFGSDEVKAKYLRPMISGQSIGAVCIADDSCGCDPGNTSVKAQHVPEEGLFILSGKKTWVTNGPTADVFTVFANVLGKDESGVMKDLLTAFVVER